MGSTLSYFAIRRTIQAHPAFPAGFAGGLLILHFAPLRTFHNRGSGQRRPLAHEPCEKRRLKPLKSICIFAILTCSGWQWFRLFHSFPETPVAACVRRRTRARHCARRGRESMALRDDLKILTCNGNPELARKMCEQLRRAAGRRLRHPVPGRRDQRQNQRRRPRPRHLHRTADLRARQ